MTLNDDENVHILETNGAHFKVEQALICRIGAIYEK